MNARGFGQQAGALGRRAIWAVPFLLTDDPLHIWSDLAIQARRVPLPTIPKLRTQPTPSEVRTREQLANVTSSGSRAASDRTAQRLQTSRDRSQRVWTGAETLVVATWAQIAGLGARDEKTPPTIGRPVYFEDESGNLILDDKGRPIEIVPGQNPGGLIASRLYPLIVETLSRKAPVRSLCVAGVGNAFEAAYARSGKKFLFNGVDQGKPLTRPIECLYLGDKRLSVEDISLAKFRFADEVIWYSAHLDKQQISRKHLAYSEQRARQTFRSFLIAQKAMGDFIVDSTKDYREVDEKRGRVVAMIEDFQLCGTAFATLAAWIAADRDPDDLDIRHFWHIPEVSLSSMRAMGMPDDVLHDFYLLRAFNYTVGMHTKAYGDEFLQSLKELKINFAHPESMHFKSEECRGIFGDAMLHTAATIMHDKLRALSPDRERIVLEVTAKHLHRYTKSIAPELLQAIKENGLSSIVTADDVLCRRLDTVFKDAVPRLVINKIYRNVDAVLGVPRVHDNSVKIDLEARARLMESDETKQQARDTYSQLFATPLGKAGVQPHRYPTLEDKQYGVDMNAELRTDVAGFVGRDDFKNGNPSLELAYFLQCSAFNKRLQAALGRDLTAADLAHFDLVLERAGIASEDLPPFLVSGTARARDAKVAYRDVLPNKELMAARDAFVIENVKRTLLHAKEQYDTHAISLDKFNSIMQFAAMHAANKWLYAAHRSLHNEGSADIETLSFEQISRLGRRAPRNPLAIGKLNHEISRKLLVAPQTEYDREYWTKRGIQEATKSLPIHGLAPMNGKYGPGVNTVYDIALTATTDGGRELVVLESVITSLKTRKRVLIGTDGAPATIDTMMCIDERATGRGTQWPEFTDGALQMVSLGRIVIPKGMQWTMPSPELANRKHMIPGAIVLHGMRKVPPVTRAIRFWEAIQAAQRMPQQERYLRDTAMRYMASSEQGVVQALYETAATRGLTLQQGVLPGFDGRCIESKSAMVAPAVDLSLV